MPILAGQGLALICLGPSWSVSAPLVVRPPACPPADPGSTRRALVAAPAHPPFPCHSLLCSPSRLTASLLLGTFFPPKAAWTASLPAFSFIGVSCYRVHCPLQVTCAYSIHVLGGPEPQTRQRFSLFSLADGLANAQRTRFAGSEGPLAGGRAGRGPAVPPPGPPQPVTSPLVSSPVLWFCPMERTPVSAVIGHRHPLNCNNTDRLHFIWALCGPLGRGEGLGLSYTPRNSCGLQCPRGWQSYMIQVESEPHPRVGVMSGCASPPPRGSSLSGRP